MQLLFFFFLKSAAEIFFNVFNNRNDIVSVYNSSGSQDFFVQQTNGKTSGLSNFSSYADRLIGGYTTQSKARVISWILLKQHYFWLRQEKRRDKKGTCLKNSTIIILNGPKCGRKVSLLLHRSLDLWGFFFPVSAFPLIFQSFNYRSAVEQTSSAQYRLSFRSQTAGWVSVPKTSRMRDSKCLKATAHLIYSEREKHLPPPTQLDLEETLSQNICVDGLLICLS